MLVSVVNNRLWIVILLHVCDPLSKSIRVCLDWWNATKFNDTVFHYTDLKKRMECGIWRYPFHLIPLPTSTLVPLKLNEIGWKTHLYNYIIIILLIYLSLLSSTFDTLFYFAATTSFSYELFYCFFFFYYLFLYIMIIFLPFSFYTLCYLLLSWHNSIFSCYFLIYEKHYLFLYTVMEFRTWFYTLLFVHGGPLCHYCLHLAIAIVPVC